MLSAAQAPDMQDSLQHVAAALSDWGTWQPSMSPGRHPSVVEALTGALAARGERTQPGVLVDVGAGQGFFSVAAAARGHRVLAFDTSAQRLQHIKASLDYNGFDDLVTLHHAAVGATQGQVCIRTSPTPAAVSSSSAAAATLLSSSYSTASNAGVDNPSGVASSSILPSHPGADAMQSGPAADVNTAHAHSCIEYGQRVTLSDVLGNDTSIGAMRISTHGQAGWVLQGAMQYLKHVHKPDVIYLEFLPSAMAAAGYTDSLGLLHNMYDLGYEDVAHAGGVCDERWLNITNALRAQVKSYCCAGLYGHSSIYLVQSVMPGSTCCRCHKGHACFTARAPSLHQQHLCAYKHLPANCAGARCSQLV